MQNLLLVHGDLGILSLIHVSSLLLEEHFEELVTNVSEVALA